MSTSTNLALPYLQPAQAQKHVTVNEALLRLDALVQARVVSRSVTAQPSAPSDGQIYVLPPGKTGAAWSGMANGALAYWRDGFWEQITPRSGWLAFAIDEGRHLTFDGAAWSPLASSNTSPQPNLLANGAFDVWQRGTSFTNVSGAGAAVYVADRWALAQAGGAANQVTRQPSGRIFPRYALRLQRPSASTSTAALKFVQALESADSRPLAGKIITLSFYATKGAGFSGGTLTAEIVTGTGDDQSATALAAGGWTGSAVAGSVVITPDTGAPTTRFQLTVTAPATATQLGVRLSWTPAGTAPVDDYVDITGVTLEIGAGGAPIAWPAAARELELCQRFFEKRGFAPDQAPTDGGTSLYRTMAASTAGFVEGAELFAARKRATPQVTLYRGAGAAGAAGRWCAFQSGAWTLATSMLTSGVGVDAFIASAAGTFTVTGAYIVQGGWTADAEL